MTSKKTRGTAAVEAPSFAPNEHARRFFPDSAWQPPGSTPALQDAALREMALAMFVPHGADIASDPGAAVGAVPAGYTYFGQFLAHDLVFLDRHRPAMENLREARLELDSLYGHGPRPALRHLYARHEPAKFLLGTAVKGAKGSDLQRTIEGRAVIPDQRNDDNVIVSQMHLAYQRAHNAIVDALRAAPHALAEHTAFDEARRIVRWHHQWLALEDYLPRILDDTNASALADDLQALREGCACRASPYDTTRRPWIPNEFSLATFRFGHAQVRPRYVLNGRLGPIALTPDHPDAPGHTHLLLGRPLPEHWHVDWRFFLPHDSALHGDLPPIPAHYLEPARHLVPQRSRPVTDKLSARLLHAELSPGEPPDDAIVALRTLRRGWQMRLPSGQHVARLLGLAPIASPVELPLWTYVLAEARETSGGRRLGPVGSWIVREVVFGLVRDDPESYLAQRPTWTPVTTSGARFELFDFLRMGDRPIDPELASLRPHASTLHPAPAGPAHSKRPPPPPVSVTAPARRKRDAPKSRARASKLRSR